MSGTNYVSAINVHICRSVVPGRAGGHVPGRSAAYENQALDNQSTKTKHWAQEDQTVSQIESLLGEERQERAAEIEPTEDVEDVYPVIKLLQPSATQNTPVYYEGIRLL